MTSPWYWLGHADLQITPWSLKTAVSYHCHDKAQDEVDLVIETGRGMLIGLEVKPSAAAKTDDDPLCSLARKPLSLLISLIASCRL